MPSANYPTTVDPNYPELILAHQPRPQAPDNMQLQPLEDRVTSLVTGILACYVQLSQLPTLRPSGKVNAIFEDLVHLCCVTSDEDVAEKVSNGVASAGLQDE